MTKRFVSEPIRPVGTTLDARSLAAGEPSLPEGFAWRGCTRQIAEILAKEKGTRVESFSGEKYVHRHVYRLRMDDGAVWNVYFARHPGPGARRGGPRWFLQTIESEAEGKGKGKGDPPAG